MKNITAKIQAIKESAKKNLTNTDDCFNLVDKYLLEINNIREKNKLHNEDKSKILLETFFKTKQELLKRKESDSEYDWSEYLEDLELAYLKYAKENASLDRLGKATLFYDSITDMYIRISKYTDIETNGKKVDRIRTDRFKPATINKYIDLESKQLIGMHIETKSRTSILREFKPYIKEFTPLKPAFYGEFFNTYVPNGFLDVKVNNVLDVNKFTEITLPQRYPIINALLENIAPYIDERIFYLIGSLQF